MLHECNHESHEQTISSPFLQQGKVQEIQPYSCKVSKNEPIGWQPNKCLNVMWVMLFSKGLLVTFYSQTILIPQRIITFNYKMVDIGSNTLNCVTIVRYVGVERVRIWLSVCLMKGKITVESSVEIEPTNSSFTNSRSNELQMWGSGGPQGNQTQAKSVKWQIVYKEIMVPSARRTQNIHNQKILIKDFQRGEL